MTTLIINGERVALSQKTIKQVRRMQMEHRIMSVFSVQPLTHKEIEQKLGLPQTTIRNHVSRMVEKGSLRKTIVKAGNYNIALYEVVR